MNGSRWILRITNEMNLDPGFVTSLDRRKVEGVVHAIFNHRSVILHALEFANPVKHVYVNRRVDHDRVTWLHDGARHLDHSNTNIGT